MNIEYIQYHWLEGMCGCIVATGTEGLSQSIGIYNKKTKCILNLKKLDGGKYAKNLNLIYINL